MKVNYELWFILEIKKNGKLNQSYLVEPSLAQFYRTSKLNERDHFQLRGPYAIQAYEDELRSEGLQKVDPSEIDAASQAGKPFYSVLDASSNHFLPDIDVVNFGDDVELMACAREMRLSELGMLMYSDPRETFLTDDRGNLKKDIGFTPQSQTDRSVIEGMNVPRFTTKHDDDAGVGSDPSLTVSMIKAGCGLKHFVDMAQQKFGQDWDDFTGEFRRDNFPRRVAQERGVEDYRNFILEGATVGITGTMPSGSFKMLNRHRDQINATSDTHKFYWGISLHEWVQYPNWKQLLLIRLAFGGYGKKCLDDVSRRYSVNTEILQGLSSWRNNNPELFTNGVELLYSDTAFPFRFVRPRADKAIYFSIFIHGLLVLGRKFGYDKGILMEAVYAMCLSPSPAGWYMGIMAVVDNLGGRNLIIAFIDYMVEVHRSVSAGPGRRRQPSHGRGIDTKELFVSIRNLARHATLASSSASTRDIVRGWTRHSSAGGVHGVGELICQEQIYVLTGASYIRNLDHINNVFLSRGTETVRRLATLGVLTPTHRAEVIRFLEARMRLGSRLLENGMCEWQRDENPRVNVWRDTVASGQSLYTIKKGGVECMGVDGIPRTVGGVTWRYDMIGYEHGVRWWDEHFDFEQITGRTIFSRNK